LANAELEKKLAEALEQQAATSEILRIIRSSPGNIQPVFDTIAANAVRLCSARMGAVHLFDGKLVHIVARSPRAPPNTKASCGTGAGNPALLEAERRLMRNCAR
jgi:two-component system, NtrC family, sensor kinase